MNGPWLCKRCYEQPRAPRDVLCAGCRALFVEAKALGVPKPKPVRIKQRVKTSLMLLDRATNVTTETRDGKEFTVITLPTASRRTMLSGGGRTIIPDHRKKEKRHSTP